LRVAQLKLPQMMLVVEGGVCIVLKFEVESLEHMYGLD